MLLGTEIIPVSQLSGSQQLEAWSELIERLPAETMVESLVGGAAPRIFLGYIKLYRTICIYIYKYSQSAPYPNFMAAITPQDILEKFFQVESETGPRSRPHKSWFLPWKIIFRMGKAGFYHGKTWKIIFWMGTASVNVYQCGIFHRAWCTCGTCSL